MRFHLCPSTSASARERSLRSIRVSFRRSAAGIVLALLVLFRAGAQVPSRAADSAEFKALPSHVPLWANDANFVAPVPPDQAMGQMTLVLARDPARETAFEKLLDDQQNPGSPLYHRWLTSNEIGARYGLTDDELDTVKGWLESQGLHVAWVAAGRNFIAFTGSAGDVSRAFQADLNYYDVNGERRISISTDPMLPAEVAPRVKAIQGLYTVTERPQHRARVERHAAPDVTENSTTYSVGPADFNKIYDVPAMYTGSGVTIGIAARSRTDFADFSNFRTQTATTFANPTEVIPTAFGGQDPGPAYTTQQPSTVELGDQLEATLDVFRAGSVAPQAKLLLVAATAASGGIVDDAYYLIQSDPVPAQIANFSFGACELTAGLANVDLWGGLFQQAAGEGISVFIASGDSGASGCDEAFNPPPADPEPNSPNFLCSSGYVTCMGGTEFNDATNYAKYWSATNGPGFESALSYIPEGGWNEQPQNSSNEYEMAASGGGVSQYISTPAWQKGAGVPAARAGRYSPDLAFSSSLHDGYFGCSAADGGSCVPNAQGEFYFIAFGGTSAAAPSMAGVTALLDQKLGEKQGNLSPQLYALAATAPKAFHDVTVATSGVSGCTLAKPSMCNNSAPAATSLTGGQAGFEVGAGFDRVTGLGSLDVNEFLESYVPTAAPPAIATGKAASVTATKAELGGTVNPNGQKTQYWFLYGKSSTLAGAAKSAAQTVSGSTAVAVTASIAGLAPVTKYYFELRASNSAGSSTGIIASFLTPKSAQTIDFAQPAPVVYGVKPIKLSAKASSGLPVTLTLIQGHATLSGTTLTIHGAGVIVVRAGQAGNHLFDEAANVSRSIHVEKAELTVAAKNESMTKGGKVPALTYAITGFVDGDTQAKAVHGAPSLATTASSSSPAGSYPIKVTTGNLQANEYTFKLVNGTMVVNP